jgi:hypothetical protein
LPAETLEGAAKDPATMIRAENPKKIAIALPIAAEASQSPENTPQNRHRYDATGAVFIRWSGDNQYRGMLNPV